ncbi:MAG: RdgB/HAM1 family non-canonical purine NTP pyrophosphatase [Bacteroidia bacterium]
MDKPKWLFATNNAHKLEEAREILANCAEIVSLQELGLDFEVEENGLDFLQNARIKAEAYSKAAGIPCFADDSGLCVDALHGEPGVWSARYAGSPCNHQANNSKLLQALEGLENRSAQFACVIATQGLHPENPSFEGRVSGRIAEDLSGQTGFGYDPLFIPDGYEHSFAELGPAIKNQLSHRALALNQMAAYLLEQA